jgi:hypothetical protein
MRGIGSFLVCANCPGATGFVVRQTVPIFKADCGSVKFRFSDWLHWRESMLAT